MLVCSLLLDPILGGEMFDDACWTDRKSDIGDVEIECQDKALTGNAHDMGPQFSQFAGDITRIKIYKNSLSGTIPTQLGQLSKLVAYVDYRNQISGTLPTELALLTEMTEINVYKNYMSGTIPSGLTQDWNNFVIMNNGFTGCVPIELTVCSDELPNNSVNGYCSMSTQGSPGIDGNCVLSPSPPSPRSPPSPPSSGQRVPCGQFVGGASTADQGRYVCAKEVPNKLFNANANRAELFNAHEHSTMFQCSPAALPEGVYSDPTRMLDAHVYELEAKKTGHSPCPSDKEFVIAGIAQVEVPTCACNVYTGGVQPEPDSIMCETVRPSVLFGTVKSRVECSPTNEDDSAVGGEAGGAETYHRCRSDSTPCTWDGHVGA